MTNRNPTYHVEIKTKNKTDTKIFDIYDIYKDTLAIYLRGKGSRGGKFVVNLIRFDTVVKRWVFSFIGEDIQQNIIIDVIRIDPTGTHTSIPTEHELFSSEITNERLINDIRVAQVAAHQPVVPVSTHQPVVPVPTHQPVVPAPTQKNSLPNRRVHFAITEPTSSETIPAELASMFSSNPLEQRRPEERSRNILAAPTSVPNSSTPVIYTDLDSSNPDYIAYFVDKLKDNGYNTEDSAIENVIITIYDYMESYVSHLLNSNNPIPQPLSNNIPTPTLNDILATMSNPIIEYDYIMPAFIDYMFPNIIDFLGEEFVTANINE